MARAYLLLLLIALAGSPGCKRTEPAGAVVVVFRTDGSLLNLDTLQVKVRSANGKQNLLDQGYPASLPATLAIVSDGDPGLGVILDASVWSAGRPVDAREYQIEDIPTSKVVELDVTFGSRCSGQTTLTGANAVSSCTGDGTTCSPATGQCDGARIEYGSLLPPYDAGAALRRVLAGDAGANDATFDVDSTGDAAPDVSCEAGAVRCAADHAAVERCVDGNAWSTDVACTVGQSHCVEGACVAVPPSCAGAPSGAGVDCLVGPMQIGDCCATDVVPGGTYDRSYDGQTYDDTGSPAQVSAFLLDDYEVTVGRFRQFVNACLGPGGCLPDAGAGIHAHLRAGAGLANVVDGGPAYETGWDPSWNAFLPTKRVDWNTILWCDPNESTWTQDSDAVENRPINCVNWYEAYAFCIWDGGFLPSEAEWNFAAAGGAEQRPFPWGATAPGPNADLAAYGCHFGTTPDAAQCSNELNIAPVGYSWAGRGAFGQSDLAGNMAEWTLDWNVPYVVPCDDCAAVGSKGKQRVERGGSFNDDVGVLLAAARPDAMNSAHYPDQLFPTVGVRCARRP
jgi:formylglycine-generating enzyme required for sulfatase activity